MRKNLIASIITGIAILSLSLTQSFAMGGGMGGGGGVSSGSMHGSSGAPGGTMSGSSSYNNGTMHNGSQQQMSDEDHAVLQNQHMNGVEVDMGTANSANNPLRKGPTVIPYQGTRSENSNGRSGK